ncbi:MAG: PAS domain S-box protein [Spirochaetales bacterium]|nr:PAS domain S-box protein [Spirochaetales bacterium]
MQRSDFMKVDKFRFELSTRVVRPILIYLERLYGRDILKQFVLETDMNLVFLDDEKNWVSFEYFNMFLKKLVEFTGNPNAPYESGKYILTGYGWMATLLHILKLFGTPAMVYERVAALSSTFSNIGRMTTKRISKNKILLETILKPGFQQTRFNCEAIQGQVSLFPTFWRLPPAKIKEIHCAARGAESCLYEISWMPRPLKTLVMGGIGLLIMAAEFFVFFTQNVTIIDFKDIVISGFALLSIFAFLKINSYKKVLQENEVLQRERSSALEEALMRSKKEYLMLKKENLKSLKDSEERYHAIFDQSPLGVLQFDTRLIVTDCNDRLCRIFRMEREKIIGADLHEVSEYAVVPKMLDAVQGWVSRYEGPYKTGQNDFTIYLSIIMTPLRDNEGSLIGAIGVFEDITERKKAKDQLNLSEEKNRLLIENASDGIAVIQDFKFVFVNQRFRMLTGWSDEKVDSSPFTDVVHPDDRQLLAENHLNRIQGKLVPGIHEIRFLHEDGSIKWVTLNAVLFKWMGKPASLCFIRDITEKKWAEEERSRMELKMQQTQKLESLGILAGGIAHDFNNILMVIMSNIDLSMHDLPKNSGVVDNLKDAVKASQRAAELCRQMLAYSGRGRLVKEVVSLSECVKDMRHMIEVAVSKKITLKFDFREGTPAVEVDTTQLRQIIMNLVINASEAIGENKGTITLSSGAVSCNREYLSKMYLDDNLQEGRFVYLLVEDTGCGMDKDTQEKIFDPFFSTKFTGRGLGLASVLGIIRGHKGAVRVTSEKGKGTAFQVFFPASSAAVEKNEPELPAGDSWKGSGTILFAEDEAGVLNVGKQMLSHLGFEVLTAANGVEALELYKQKKDRIVCVILDLKMPKMDGKEVFKEIRNMRVDLPVLFSTGYNEQEIYLKPGDEKCTAFIQKPYQIEDLASRLRKILE